MQYKNDLQSMSIMNNILEFYKVTHEDVGMFDCKHFVSNNFISLLYLYVNDPDSLIRIQENNLPESIKLCNQTDKLNINFMKYPSYAVPGFKPQYIIRDNGFYMCLPTKPFNYDMMFVAMDSELTNSLPRVDLRETGNTGNTSNIQLTCSLNRIPDRIELKWNYPEAIHGSRIKIRENKNKSILEVNDIQITDTGYYTCFVSNSTKYEKQIYSQTFFMHIWNETVFKITKHVTSIGFDRTFLYVEFYGYMRKHQWMYFNRSKIYNPQLYDIVDSIVSSKLIFLKPHSSQSSIYTFMSSTYNGDHDELDFKISIPDPPSVTTSFQYTGIGKSIRGLCSIESFEPPQVSFKFQNCERASEHGLSGSCENVDELINSTTENITNSKYSYELNFNTEMSGFLWCVASNKMGENNSREYVPFYNFENENRIQIKIDNEEEQKTKGDDVKLECFVPVIIPSNHIKIFHNKHLIEPNEEIKLLRVSGHEKSSLIIHFPKIDHKHSGNYTCQIYNGYSSIEINVREPLALFVDSSLNNNLTIEKDVGDSVKLDCMVKGRPEPKITWSKKDDNENNYIIVAKNISHHIPVVHEKSAGIYKCVAENRISYLERFINLKVNKPMPLYLKVTIPLVVILIIILFVVCYYYVRSYRERKQLSKFLEGDMTDGNLAIINPELPLKEQVDQLPYDKRFEFPRTQLKLGKILGSGAFGFVIGGEATNIKEGEERTQVAVKMIRKSANNQAFGALVSELKIMAHLGQHLNIVNLLGAVTKNIVSKELMVIMEFCPYGSLENILKNNRNSFTNLINTETDEIEFTLKPSGTQSNHYVQHLTEDAFKLNTMDLVYWSYQIASGMNYLSSKRVLHGDLAARNILLSENNIVKICDFGLANSLYDKQYYRKAEGTLLPMKWLALEAIEDNVFTTYTDIWSYGVVMWELFSLGQSPYMGMKINHHFYLKLRDGYRLEKPLFANKDLYNIMLLCWHADPMERPLFFELMLRLASLMTDSNMVVNELYAMNDF